MTIYSLITAPNPLLRSISEPVLKVDKELQIYLDDLLETMYHEKGAGLASIQVGIPKRIMVIDVGHREIENRPDPHFFINPEIVWFSEEQQIYPEGCLSFPGGYLEISRPKTIRVRYLDYNGKEQEKQVTDWMARAVQHELDHLNGVVLIDHVSKLKGDLLMKKVIKFVKNK